MKVAAAFAPASIGNVAVGFDVLGQALEAPGDTATVTLTTSGVVTVKAIRGCPHPLPLEASANTAGRALQSLLAHAPKGTGFEVELDKGIALGSGMGGSAASAVAALVAANSLLPAPVSGDVLYQAAMDGEAAASGSRHGDNVAPSLLGGLVIAPEHGSPIRVPVPPWLWVALVHPHAVLETKRARAALAGSYALSDFVHQSERLAVFLAGCHAGDAALVRRGLDDVLVEPRRAPLIQGFAQVKAAALAAGALGASISGAGPSVFAWCDGRAQAQAAAAAMVAAFRGAGVEADAFVSAGAAPGARVVPS